MIKTASEFTTWAIENNYSEELDIISRYLEMLASQYEPGISSEVSDNEAKYIRHQGGDVLSDEPYQAANLYHVADRPIGDIAKAMFPDMSPEVVDSKLTLLLKELSSIKSGLDKDAKKAISEYFDSKEMVEKPERQRVIRRRAAAYFMSAFRILR